MIDTNHTLDRNVPSPAQFNHMITMVQSGKDPIWLDATVEVAPFGMLMASERDKDALVIGKDGSAPLLRTPEITFANSFDHFKLRGELSDAGELEASGLRELRGDEEIMVRTLFHQKSESEWNSLARVLSLTIGLLNSINLVNATPPEKTEEPFRMVFSYDWVNYSNWANSKRLTPPLPWISIPTIDDNYEKANEPIYLGGPQMIDYSSELKLPQGYIPQLPANVDVKSEFAEYHSRYSYSDGVLHAERKIAILVTQVVPSQFRGYREFRNRISGDQEAWITFSRPQ